MRAGLVAGVLATGLLAAGCGLGEPAAEAESPIPRVTEPRDVAVVAGWPCGLLSPEQAARFGLDRPPKLIQGVLGNMECEWRSSRADVWVYISIFTDKPTLEEVYERREILPYFELTEIRGYPAIVSRADATLPVCDIDIKTAERQSVTVSYDATRFNDQLQQGCVVGRQVAAAVLSNVPPKT